MRVRPSILLTCVIAVATLILMCGVAMLWFENQRLAQRITDMEQTLTGTSSNEPRHATETAHDIFHAMDRHLAAESRRMQDIARAMMATGWDTRIPSPTMDLRQDGETCELVIAFPEPIAAENIQLSAENNILTIAMNSPASGTSYRHRVRIPKEITSIQDATTTVSNNVLRIRIP